MYVSHWWDVRMKIDQRISMRTAMMKICPGGRKGKKNNKKRLNSQLLSFNVHLMWDSTEARRRYQIPWFVSCLSPSLPPSLSFERFFFVFSTILRTLKSSGSLFVIHSLTHFKFLTLSKVSWDICFDVFWVLAFESFSYLSFLLSLSRFLALNKS